MTCFQNPVKYVFNNNIRHLNLFLLIALLTMMHANLFFFNILFIKDNNITRHHFVENVLKTPYKQTNENSQFGNKQIELNKNINSRLKRNVTAYIEGKPVPQDLIEEGTDLKADSRINKDRNTTKAITTKTPSTPKSIYLFKSTSKPEVTVATTKKELDWVDATEYVNKNIAEEKLKKESADKETVNEETGDKDTVESVLHSEPVRPKYEFVLNFHMPHDSLKSLGEGLLLAAPGIGMLLGFAPVSKLIFKVGIKNSLFVLGLLSSFGMAFIPLVLGDHNRIYLIVARIFLGFISAGTFASIGSHIIKWQPIRDQTSSLNLSMLSIVLGPLFSWPLVYFCDGSTSTKNVHYVLAVLTIIISIIFYFIYRNNPSEHAWVKGTELFKIQTRKVLSTRLNKNSIMKVLKSFDTWNIVACSLAYFHLISFAVTLLPVFAATVLKKEGHSLIMSSTTPIILQILSHVAMHYLQKSLELSSSVYRTRMCNSIAYFTSALFLASCMVVFSKNLNETIIYTLVACSFAPIGFVFFGFLQCTTSIGKLYGQYIITLFQLAFALALTFTPFLAIFGASNNLLVEWKFFFLIIAIIFLLCNIAYILLVETQPLDFAENSWLPDTKDTNQTVRLIRFEDDCGIMEMKAIKK